MNQAYNIDYVYIIGIVSFLAVIRLIGYILLWMWFSYKNERCGNIRYDTMHNEAVLDNNRVFSLNTVQLIPITHTMSINLSIEYLFMIYLYCIEQWSIIHTSWHSNFLSNNNSIFKSNFFILYAMSPTFSYSTWIHYHLLYILKKFEFKYSFYSYNVFRLYIKHSNRYTLYRINNTSMLLRLLSYEYADYIKALPLINNILLSINNSIIELNTLLHLLAYTYFGIDSYLIYSILLYDDILSEQFYPYPHNIVYACTFLYLYIYSMLVFFSNVNIFVYTSKELAYLYLISEHESIHYAEYHYPEIVMSNYIHTSIIRFMDDYKNMNKPFDEIMNSFFSFPSYTIDNILIFLLDRVLNMVVSSGYVLIINGICYNLCYYYYDNKESLFYVCAVNNKYQIVVIKTYDIEVDIGSVAFFRLFKKIVFDFFSYKLDDDDE